MECCDAIYGITETLALIEKLFTSPCHYAILFLGMYFEPLEEIELVNIILRYIFAILLTKHDV